jgi:hypothetical protein
VRVDRLCCPEILRVRFASQNPSKTMKLCDFWDFGEKSAIFKLPENGNCMHFEAKSFCH